MNGADQYPRNTCQNDGLEPPCAEILAHRLVIVVSQLSRALRVNPPVQAGSICCDARQDPLFPAATAHRPRPPQPGPGDAQRHVPHAARESIVLADLTAAHPGEPGIAGRRRCLVLPPRPTGPRLLGETSHKPRPGSLTIKCDGDGSCVAGTLPYRGSTAEVGCRLRLYPAKEAWRPGSVRTGRTFAWDTARLAFSRRQPGYTMAAEHCDLR